MSQQNNRYTFYNMIFACITGNATEDLQSLLVRMLEEDETLREDYVDYMMMYTLLHRRNGVEIFTKDNFGPVSDQLLEQFALGEITAPALEVPKEKPQRESIKEVASLPLKKQKITKFLIYAAVINVAVILSYVILEKFASKRPHAVEVATFVDELDAKWCNATTKFKKGDRLWTNQAPMTLEKGVVEIHYDEGVNVVVEGPAKFELDRSGIYLEYGRMYSRVSETGLGFSVKTPTSLFIDHGTEFGIQEGIDGSSELHVIKGKVQFFAGVDGLKTRQMVSENNAVRYDTYNGRIEAIDVKEQAFVRQFDSSAGMVWRGQDFLDLADVVNGGDGFQSGLHSGAICPGTGDMIPWRNAYDNPRFDRNQAYIKAVKSSPYIDSIIVPGRMGGATPLTTAGHICPDLPPVSGSLVFDIQTKSYRKSIPLVLNGILYGTYQRPAILIHSSSGLTFDLESIRKDLPGLGISRFKALCGNNEASIDPERPDYDVEMRIFLDGNEVYHKVFPHTSGTAIPIEIDLSKESYRYLTLLVTSGKGNNNADWFVFGEPRLQLYEK